MIGSRAPRCTAAEAEAAASVEAAADAVEAAEVRSRPLILRAPPPSAGRPARAHLPETPHALLPSPRAGRGGGGGGQRWWDPEWRASKLAEMREESGRDRVEVDADAVRAAVRVLRDDPSRDEIVYRENFGRDGADLVEAIAREHNLYFKRYGKGTNTVLVASVHPLPNYRHDLDARRQAEHELRVSDAAAATVRAALDRTTRPGDEDDVADANETDARAKRQRQRLRLRRDAAHAPLRRDPDEDARAAAAERARLDSPSASALGRSKLPASSRREAILDAIARSQVVVVSGETGCGKTTQLPQFVLESELAAGNASVTSVVCTQPRRISAVSVAARVARERGEALGRSVGYQIRLEAKRSSETKLLFCTTGVLLRRLAAEPTLASVSHVFVDEIHERGMNEDFLLVVLRDLLPRRPDLKIVLMSATLDAELFAGYFGGAPLAHIPGFTHPVREVFLEDILESAGGAVTVDPATPAASGSGFRRRRGARPPANDGDGDGSAPVEDPIADAPEPAEWSSLSPRTIRSLRAWTANCALEDKVDVALVRDVVRLVVTTSAAEDDGRGAVLVFLTGWDEISKLVEMCGADPVLGDASRCRVLPLHGAMPTADQREIFDPPPAGVRKIVLATNIAETSITIDDVVHVVDAGKSKEKTYDALNNMACLSPSWTSKASARQRRGRAGRTRPGVCYRVYTRAQHAAMADHAAPELLRTPLEELCLTIKSLGLGSAAAFVAKALEPPEERSVRNALALLTDVGALDADERLTPLGEHLAALPVDPRVGKMLVVAAALGCLSPALTIAAGMAYKDPFVLPLDKKHQADAARRALAADTRSDHVALVRAFEGWERARREGGHGRGRDFCRVNFLAHNTLELMADMRRQFWDLLESIGLVGGGRGGGGRGAMDSPLASHNRHAHDVGLLRAVICAGMFPNLVCVRRRGKRCEFKTREDGKVDLHPSSVNARFGQTFPFSWLAYREKVKTTGVYIRDSTCVPAHAVVLLGGALEEGDDGESVKMCGGAYVFSASASTVGLVRRLRSRLDAVLAAKARDPELDVAAEGGAIVDAVRALIAEEAAEAAAEAAEAGAADAAAFGEREDARDRGGRFDEGGGGGGGGRGGRFHRGGRGRAGFRGGGGREGDWACPRGCGMVFASKPVCFRCGTPRP